MRWAILLTLVLALDQLETAPPPSASQAALVEVLRPDGPARETRPPINPPEEDSSRPSESEESLEGRGKGPRAVGDAAGGDRAWSIGGAAPGPDLRDRRAGAGGPFGRRPTGGRGVCLMFQSHRC
ncbi:hypothetical protein [Tautonia plasticadhaerens]|uniref:Uncharacterized protein n=1 Tax=Tautonia plasticadhaerens TaxID=2527974 RepID=A0A518HCK1_9BACT|nr:hypothetical protein [Tautonia plasticadhaerens]QDV38594.1 hypothetical protein ElP_65490 [Tautonia plasticadhaerens]